MHRIGIILLLSFILITGCTESSKHDLDDPAAVVLGEEITVGDIRFFGEIEDKDLPQAVEYFVEERLMIHEAKDMGLDVSNENEDYIGGYPPEDTNTESANKIREFSEAQAEKFDMEPEEYYEEFVSKSAERSAYRNAFLREHLDEQPENLEEHEVMNEDYKEIVNELMEKYEDDIEIYID